MHGHTRTVIYLQTHVTVAHAHTHANTPAHTHMHQHTHTHTYIKTQIHMHAQHNNCQKNIKHTLSLHVKHWQNFLMVQNDGVKIHL